MQEFLYLLRFYYKHNKLVIICENGKKIRNPIKIPKFLHIGIHQGSHDNTIIIDKNQKPDSNIQLNFNDASFVNVEIGKNNMICMNATIIGKNGNAIIGKDNHVCDARLYLYCSGKTNFKIGNGNLFSDGIVLWAGEGHSVISTKTKKITNSGGCLTVGNDNWVCQNVCLLKRAKIGNGCIVGYGSVIGSDFSDNHNSVIAGNPGQIVKHDVLWSEQAPWYYSGGIYRKQKQVKD